MFGPETSTPVEEAALAREDLARFASLSRRGFLAGASGFVVALTLGTGRAVADGSAGGLPTTQGGDVDPLLFMPESIGETVPDIDMAELPTEELFRILAGGSR